MKKVRRLRCPTIIPGIESTSTESEVTEADDHGEGMRLQKAMGSTKDNTRKALRTENNPVSHGTTTKSLNHQCKPSFHDLIQPGCRRLAAPKGIRLNKANNVFVVVIVVFADVNLAPPEVERRLDESHSEAGDNDREEADDDEGVDNGTGD
ncbi:hypothetical protein BDZ89DRAFT_1039927 [Hymenopellis radicata]|nr:hypothetical protein BDZ89DRAFT_1039927 [Hymenopellis radicata]